MSVNKFLNRQAFINIKLPLIILITSNLVIAIDNQDNLNKDSNLISDNLNYLKLDQLTKNFTAKYLLIAALATISVITLSTHLIQLDSSEKEIKRKNHRKRFKDKLNNFATSIMDGINYGKSKFSDSNFSQPGLNLKDPEYKKSYDVASKTGIIGGLVNDGNTCFMNSVLQSLASSNEFMEFLQEYTLDSKDLKFSQALNTLLTKINDKHFNRSGYYKTSPLMKTLPNGPNRNLIMGYDQEDAQEFYQLVLKEVEKEYVRGKELDKTSSNPSDLFVNRTDDMIYGLEKLGDLGKVYVPAVQIDPNAANTENEVYPMKLVTPVDGLSLERIGCVHCGEIGGIRYSVISGLSLNLEATNKNSYTLQELLDNWILPEIIDDVECNRCGLVQMRKKVEEKIDSSNEKVALLMSQRLQEIDIELLKPVISDEAYKRLHTKNQIQKSRKIKQIFYSRPPALLTLHINRSVFDPRTYTIRKNGAQVKFPLKLDLTPYVVECDDINMDARLCFRKQDELLKDQVQETAVPELSPEVEELVEETVEEPVDTRPKQDALGNDIVYSDVSETESDEEGEDNYIPPNTNHQSNIFTTTLQQQPSPPESIESNMEIGNLTYSLKAIISHFGTHNYGHYILFRKYRGIWWRVSDETVRITTEREVLSTSGVFMLFYELSSRNDVKDTMPDVVDDEPQMEMALDLESEDESEKELKIDDDDDNSSLDLSLSELYPSSSFDDTESDEKDQDSNKNEEILDAKVPIPRPKIESLVI